MRNISAFSLILFFSLNLFSADKCDDSSSFSQRHKYPMTSFENTSLPKVRLTSRVFEFSHDKSDYEIVCFSWPPEVKKHGVKQNCKGWCVLPRSNESSTISLVEIDSSIKKCSRCEKNQTDSQCSEVKILKSTSQALNIGSGENSSVLQMGSNGSLLIFQTTNNSKDLNKPYLNLTRESEYFEKSKLEIQVRGVADTGYINTAQMNLKKGNTSHTISANSLTQRTEEIPGAQPTDGKRSCTQVQLKTSDCPENTEDFESEHYSANRYSCLPSAQESKKGNGQKIDAIR